MNAGKHLYRSICLTANKCSRYETPIYQYIDVCNSTDGLALDGCFMFSPKNDTQ